MKKTATLSVCEKYRYDLFRIWDSSKPYLMFIGLNPSTADDKDDDNTITRCINFGKNLGFGGICMCNLFGFRATNPKDMVSAQFPIGDENDFYIKKHAELAGMIIVAWGNKGSRLNRNEEVIALIDKDIYALDVNKSGQPKHPLYIASDTKPKLYKSK